METRIDAELTEVLSFRDDVPERYDFERLFGDNRPVELEIGSGKGLFLLREGAMRPDVNFLGVEWSRKYARFAAERLVRNGVANVRLVSADVNQLIPRFPDGAFQAVHVYFPDPWWKQRHRKRRLFNEAFVGEAVRILQPEGMLKVATDVEEYFHVMQKLLAAEQRLHAVDPPAPNTPAHDLDYLTHFERKYRIEGRAIYRAQYIRR